MTFVIGFVCGYLFASAGFAAFLWFRRTHKYDGVITMTETEKGLLYSLELTHDPSDLADQEEVVFKVNPPGDKQLLSR